MMLPVIDKPIYKASLLSFKDPIEFVPFTVKESKILMMAKETKELESMVTALKQIINNCLVDKTIDVDQLPMVDLEWLFLNIWARSSGERTQLYFKCTNDVSGANCDMLIDFEVDLLKVEIANKNVNKKILLKGEDTGIMMKYPTFEMTQKLAKTEGDQDVLLASLCIDYVFEKDSIIKAEDCSEEEMTSFVESLLGDKYAQIEAFLENCPSIKHEVEKDCPKCGFHHKITLEGLEDFT